MPVEGDSRAPAQASAGSKSAYLGRIKQFEIMDIGSFCSGRDRVKRAKLFYLCSKHELAERL
jgi:hypothetical protein